MSETLDATAGQEAEATETTDNALEQQQADAPEGQEAEQTADKQTEAEQPTEKKSDWREKALARETRLKHEARREVEALRKEIENLKTLMAKPESEREAAPAHSEAEIQAAAQRLREVERFNEKRQSLIDNGVEEFTAREWNEKTQILAGLGATDDPNFMQALVAVPHGHKVVAALAADPDRIVGLLGNSAVVMAAELGRISAEVASGKPKPVSTAPKPVTPIAARGKVEVDPAKMTMAEYVKYREKTAPRHLGGRGQ